MKYNSEFKNKIRKGIKARDVFHAIFISVWSDPSPFTQLLRVPKYFPLFLSLHFLSTTIRV
jgi:hypothetical protein